MIKLDIGGEKNKHKHNRVGWTIVDVRKEADVVCTLGIDRLPYEDNSVDAIFCSHTIEHVPPHMQENAWNEIYRVMKPGALIRAIVPDLDRAIEKYIEGDSKWFRTKEAPTKVPSLPTNVDLSYLSGFFFTYPVDPSTKHGIGPGGHSTPYNDKMLKHYLTTTGFKNIKKMGHKQYSQMFDGMDFERYKDFSVYMEATK